MLGVPAVIVTVLYSLLQRWDPVLLYNLTVDYNAPMLLWEILVVLAMFLLMAGPANRHTANDNTSGVTTLLDIMTALPTEARESVAFVFFDLEEMGLFGSAGFANQHKQIAKNTLLVNFDCVSDGDTILFALRGGLRGMPRPSRPPSPPPRRMRWRWSLRGCSTPRIRPTLPVAWASPP